MNIKHYVCNSLTTKDLVMLQTLRYTSLSSLELRISSKFKPRSLWMSRMISGTLKEMFMDDLLVYMQVPAHLLLSHSLQLVRTLVCVVVPFIWSVRFLDNISQASLAKRLRCSELFI